MFRIVALRCLTVTGEFCEGTNIVKEKHTHFCASLLKCNDFSTVSTRIYRPGQKNKTFLRSRNKSGYSVSGLWNSFCCLEKQRENIKQETHPICIVVDKSIVQLYEIIDTSYKHFVDCILNIMYMYILRVCILFMNIM